MTHPTMTSEKSEVRHAVFLGLYNPKSHMESLRDWLPKLDLTGTTLIIADNCSTDDSAEAVSDLVSLVGPDVVFVNNPTNLGAFGSMLRNTQHLPSGNWVTMLHQDDIYEAHHVSEHKQILTLADESLGMIFNNAISMDANHQTIAFPRAHWLLDRHADSVTVFLAHLRNHVYPFSGASIRVEALRGYGVPWHSTTFPDTELIMKMIADYRVHQAEATVRYLENLSSESHHLGNSSRKFGSYQALVRVFAHPSFAKISSLVSEKDLDQFLAALVEGINLRLGDPDLAEDLIHLAIELLASHRGMSRPLARIIYPAYEAAGDTRASDMLAGIAGESICRQSTESLVGYKKNFSGSFRALLLRAFGALAPSMQKGLFRAIMSSRLGRMVLPAWNFRWRDGER